MTRKEHELLEFLRAFIAEHGYAPSYDEMRTHLGLASKSGVNRLVVSLERQGRICREKDHPRSIRETRGLPAGTIWLEPVLRALTEAHGIDDGEGIVIACTPEELRSALVKALR